MKNAMENTINDAFKYFRLSRAARLVLTGVLYAAALTVQYLSLVPIAGIPLFLLAWPLLMVKAVSNKPDDQGFEEWKPVSMTEVDRLYDNLKKSKQLKPVQMAKSGCPAVMIGIFVFGFLMIFINVIGGFLINFGSGKMLFWLIADIIVMFIPVIFFGNVKVFIPRELDMKATSFYGLLAQPLPSGAMYTPYFRFDKDEKGKPIPEDMRIMLELKRKPDDFMGVQFQIAINNGAHGAVPYMYAVMLTRGQGSSYNRVITAAKTLKKRASGFEIEAGGDKEYGTVVIRQKTGGGGYHTDESDVLRLKDLVLEFLKTM